MWLQCDYFSVLLNGEWADSKTNEYTLEIPDENITKDGASTFSYFTLIL